ncbi:hypothetical protein MACH16_15740 [Marinomonas pontica]|uniref:Helicase/UvrB N-terminal domain-containing protein n=1 Tax=Marinomonas pontica TaxID=264739 RepID=A0ABM8FCK4_9GAMM|nr:hypothetical protein MACH16_15740 [Marinomonas pontica]
MSKTDKHRSIVREALSTHTYEHQRQAAERTFSKFQNGARAVVIAAEMQSGKSGIALALASMQRLSLSDEIICQRKYLKDTLYLVTMADVALQEQAKNDLAACHNVVVSNFAHFESCLKGEFKFQAPKLIIIDECHYGSATDSVRYAKVFDYLENINLECRIAFVSATPFSALYAASDDSILRHNFHTALVFHKTSNEYHGIREMHRHQQIVKLDENNRDFCDALFLSKRFIRQFQEHEGSGWSLIRVPTSQAKQARDILLESGIESEQIHIIGQKLVGLEDHELCSLEDFKREYETAKLFDDKLIAITVAGFRAGVNFGQEMKENLINSWDSSISNIAAVVQANVGRACGYHHNTTATHYTNLDSVRAYGELLDFLEEQDERQEFQGIREKFEDICERYEIRGFDRGTSVTPAVLTEVSSKRKLVDKKVYLTQSYVVVPGKLDKEQYDYNRYTKDLDLLEAIRLIREELLADGEPYRKQGRALRGEHQNWIKAQWVNGATYDDGTPSCAKSRALHFTQLLDQLEPVEFNKIVNPGGGETTDSKRVMASIFSIYNLSGQKDAFKRALDIDDMSEICRLFGFENDDTLILLYKRGDFLRERSSDDQEKVNKSRIQHNSILNTD